MTQVRSGPSDDQEGRHAVAREEERGQISLTMVEHPSPETG